VRKSIGLFGGTFDPIHDGHLRSALEIQEKLLLDEIRLIPCNHPPLKPEPLASAIHRINMIRLAIQKTPFILDDIELKRAGPSYSVETLKIFRDRYPDASLCMIVGVDAFLNLPSWHQWEKLIQLSNIVVMYRGGYQMPVTGVMFEFLNKHLLTANQDIRSYTAGYIVELKTTELNMSGTEIRDLIKRERDPRFLLPESVWAYIQSNELYGYSSKTKTTKSKIQKEANE